ncbi:hypothetical protein JTE90_010933 [Oedothorax gibbosus]|uniref:RNA-directed DNA polymerase n=1 Tax=Oedothorax gibbosus TaxID=931172 RepID=A0AAV6TR05_9ARAC|nr:hypothetical protein JTE90_010933 [Oedothorax gibbosus]
MADMKSPSSMRLEGNVAENWAKFKQRFTFYLEATEKTSKPDKTKVALLLGIMGEDCIEIYNNFKLSDEDSQKFDTVIDRFDKHFAPSTNTVIARYKFFNCRQQPSESIDSFINNLKTLAKDCKFEDQEESLVRDLLIMGIKDVNVKEKLLIDSELNLDKAINYCRAKETSQNEIKLMQEGGNSLKTEINAVKYNKKNTKPMVLDASSAFLQIPLAEESSKLCTIATPFGRYCFCRLPYGLASSPEVYQKAIDNIFSGLEGILVYIDDILVYGKTEEEHDIRLKSVLDMARKQGLNLSKEKSQIKVNSVKYLGYNLTSEGLSVNVDKIKAISEYKSPENKAELQREEAIYVADALSRAPGSDVLNTPFLEAGAATVHAVLTSSKEKTEQLQQATEEDPELSMVKTYLKEGWPSSIQHLTPEVRPYWNIKSEIHHYEGLLFLGRRTIIPKAMREEVLMKLHVAHQGITSCQRKAKNTLYWPNLMEDIKKMVECCQTCQAYQRSNTRQPLIPHEVPTLPWENIGIDFLYVNGDEFLQVIDYHSKFIEVKKVSSKTAEYIVSALKQIFRTHGIPR